MKEKHSHIHFHGSLVHSHIIPSHDSDHKNIRIISIDKKRIKHEHLNYEHEHEHSHREEHKHQHPDKESQSELSN